MKNTELAKHNSTPADFAALANFTSLLVAHGRDYAKSNYKDFGRDIARYVSNARILPILSAQDIKQFCDLQQLRADLGKLHLECHPLDAPDFRADIAAVRENLKLISLQIQRSFPCRDCDEHLKVVSAKELAELRQISADYKI